MGTLYLNPAIYAGLVQCGYAKERNKHGFILQLPFGMVDFWASFVWYGKIAYV